MRTTVRRASAGGEIVDRATRAYDLRSRIARVRGRSDLDEDQVMELVREELRATRAERHKITQVLEVGA